MTTEHDLRRLVAEAVAAYFAGAGTVSGPLRPRAAPIPAFSRHSGLGRTKIYDLLKEGLLEAVTIGGRQHILFDSYDRLIDDQRVARRTEHKPAARISRASDGSAA